MSDAIIIAATFLMPKMAQTIPLGADLCVESDLWLLVSQETLFSLFHVLMHDCWAWAVLAWSSLAYMFTPSRTFASMALNSSFCRWNPTYVYASNPQLFVCPSNQLPVCIIRGRREV